MFPKEQLRIWMHEKLCLSDMVANHQSQTQTRSKKQSVLWLWSFPGMWEMWVLPVVAGNIPFPGVCLSFPTGCIKSVEGGAVNDAGTF